MKMGSVVFLRSFALISMAICFVSCCCPSGWIFYNYSCYTFIRTPANWMEAQFDCHNKNASLAILETSEEQEWIRINSHGMPYMWLGGRVDKERVWRWVYGGSNYWPEINDTDWALGQPDSVGQMEFCLHTNWGSGRQWNDRPCLHRITYVCELPHTHNQN